MSLAGTCYEKRNGEIGERRQVDAVEGPSHVFAEEVILAIDDAADVIAHVARRGSGTGTGRSCGEGRD